MMLRTLTQSRRLFLQTILRFDRDDGMFLASGLSFNIIMCVLPFLLILASLWGYFLESSQQAQQDILAFVAEALPAAVDEVRARVEELLHHRGLIGLVGLLSLVWTASRLFAGIRVVMKITFGVEKRFNYVTGKLFDVGMVALTCLILFLSLLAASSTAVLDAWRESLFELIGYRWDFIRGRIGFGFVYLISSTLLFLLYRLPLPASVPTRIVALQAFIVGALWEAAKRLFQLYLANLEDFDVLYGSFGVLVMLVLWVQYSAITFVAGAELGAVLHEMRGAKKIPAGVASS